MMSIFGAYNTQDTTTGNTVLAANQTLIIGPLQTGVAQEVAGSVYTDQSGVLYIEQSFDAGFGSGNANEQFTVYLTSALSTGGGAITALPVSAIPSALIVGTTVQTSYAAPGAPDGTFTQQWTLTAPASASATSLTVASQVPNYNYPTGGTVICGGLSFDVISSNTITVTTPGTGQAFNISAALVAPVVRIRYVNGGTAQGVFRFFGRTYQDARN
jgi:hypothetical protein